MPLGSVVRRLFGRHETLISELWRSAFVDLDALIAQVGKWSPNPKSILEIGCGEGAGTSRLARQFPNAEIVAIDISDRLGRLYSGRRNGVCFERITVQEIASQRPAAFDLIVMCDVLHHIPETLRPDILDATRRLLRSDGSFVFKDWERTATPIHWASHAADRWLTGDRVSYITRGEAVNLLEQCFGRTALSANATIRPWRNNFVMLVGANG